MVAARPSRPGAFQKLVARDPIRTYFIGECDDPHIESVRSADITAYLTWRRVLRLGGGKVTNRTLGKDRAVLHRIFAFAEVLELREGNR